MTPDTATPGSEPQRLGDVPVARLLRVIADRIDQGWPAPSNINGLTPDSLGVTLNFHRQADDAYLQWVDLFSAELLPHETRSEPAKASYPAYTFNGYLGSHLGQRVRVDAYVLTEDGADDE